MTELEPLQPGTTAELVDEVLDVAGVARLLRIGRNKVYSLVSAGELPVRRVGKALRFSRARLLEWVRQGEQLRPTSRRRYASLKSVASAR